MNNLFFKIFIFLVIVLFSKQDINAQSKSNKGKDFWVGFMKHREGSKSKTSLYITSDSNTTGVVSVPGQSWSQNFSVTANSVTVVTIPSSNSYNDCSDCITKKGVHVTSVKDVIVYAHHYQDNQSDATLVLPTRTLGKDYYIVGYNQISPSSSGRNTFGIVSVKDQTRIKITPKQAISKNGGGTLPANVPYYINLNEGEFYQGVASSGAFSADLTGSKIEVIDTGASANCRSIAVFSGSSYLSISSGCSGFTSGDNLIEQMFPINSWGSRFVLVPALGRSSDNFRFVAAEDKTEVVIFNPGAAPDVLYLNKGEFGEIKNISAVRNVISTKPVMAVQYQRTASCDGFRNRTGDPSMTILNPLEQTLKDITLYSSSFFDIDNHYINVVIPTAAKSTFTIDGVGKTFTAVPSNANYSYARFGVNAGNHRLKAAAGFIATAYGEGRYESYGYAAGANVKDLTATASVANSTQNTITSSCVGRATKFRGYAEYNAVRWKWFFGDGDTSSTQNPTHIYSDTGVYQAKLYVYKPTFDGCSNYDSAFVELSVFNSPIAKLSHGSICDSSTVVFNDISSIPINDERLTTIWNIDDAPTKYAKNASNYFDTIGKFPIRMEVITKNQCRDTITDTLIVNPRPEADFLFNDVCFWDSSYLRNNSKISSGTIESYIWEFPSSDGDSIASPTYFLKDSGNYIITMTVISDSGCYDVTNKSVYKYPSFDVAFLYNDTCFGFGNTFKNISTIDGGSFTDTIWTTSNLDTAYSYDYENQFSSAGTYRIKLVMEQDSVCKDSFLQNINVNPLPLPDFNVRSTCFGDSTQFIDASGIISGSYSQSWDLSDGITGTGDSVKAKYVSGGQKTIQLKLVSDEGCEADTFKSIIITSPEIININVKAICKGLTQEISSTNVLGLDSFISYRWEIDGVITSTDSVFDFKAIKPGMNKIQLFVQTKNSCTISFLDSFVVYPLQSTAFFIDDHCLNLPISPTDFSTITPPSTFTKYEWFLDGNYISSSIRPKLTPANIGTHTLLLKTTSTDGCIDSVLNSFLIHPLPVNSFSSTLNCLGDNTEITNTSTISSGSIDLNQWSVDGNNFNSKNVIYKFPDVNTYPVELITISNEGCKDTLIQDVIINPLPELLISLNRDTGCVPFEIQVVNNSTIQSGSISEYRYDWGDGNSGTGSNPSFTYTNPGKYIISIRGTSDKGCTDSIRLSDSVIVFDNPKADFYYTPEEPSTLKNVITLIDSSSKDAIDWIYTVSDGGSYNGSSTQHTFKDSGTYLITLRIQNDNGCFDEETKVIYVNADLFIHIPNSFSPNGDGINDTYGLAGMTQGVFQMEMDIYNQWGEKVFHSNNVNDRWDGTYQGEPAQQGVYLFRVKYTNPKQTKWYYDNGEIHLLR
tara:strand:+ start:199 stop:4344 length:4146 start_codon:yes stop_codon:yes gene_type:complete